MRKGTIALLAVWLLLPHTGEATLLYGDGDLQIAGELQTQNLVRIQKGPSTFSAFNPVQQRNTFRLQYEHQLVKRGRLLGLADLPLIEGANFLAYYRFVYDSIYDIAPGPFLETQDGAPAGKISDVRPGVRPDIAFENVLREVYVDFKLRKMPVRLRIGRQQIVWGEAIGFRGLDSVNALDVTWHAQQEAGLLGKAGWDELRIPAYAIKATVNLPSIQPFTNLYLEAYDIPFGFTPAKARFVPNPWSLPFRKPYRGGLVVDAGEIAGGPPDLILLQPCFDSTGSIASNEDSNADFSEAAETGFCDSAGLQRTSLRQGLYDRSNPADVNQFGVRLGGIGPAGINFSLNYLYRRHLGADIPGTTVAKIFVGALLENPQDYVTLDPHETTDPVTRETTEVQGYLRSPIEFYYPYVHVSGVSLSYYEELTQSVVTGEAAWTHKVPVATLDTTSIAIRRTELVIGAINMDRPTWIRWLNRTGTWLIISQLNFLWLPFHEDVVFDDEGHALRGDVGAPNSDLIPGAFGGPKRVGKNGTDRVKALELVSILAAATFYRGGTFAPVVAWINDWANAPSMEFIVGVDYLPTPDITLSPALRIFTNFGRLTDDPWGVGRLSQWDELQLKATYRF